MIFSSLFKTRHATISLPGPFLPPQSLTGGLTITDNTTLSIPVALRCVQLLSDSIGSLPFDSYRDNEKLDPTPTILRLPDPSQTRVETLGAAVTSLVMRGNAFFLLGNRDRFGFPQSAILLSPDAVSVRMDQAGTILYQVNGLSYDSESILHIRGGVVQPGAISGAGPLQLQRRTLGLALAGDESASDLHVSGSIPSGVISSPAELTQEESQVLKSSFMRAHGGRQKSPAVLSGGLSYQALSFSPDDLQLLESRRFSAEQICTIFGVPPHLVGVPIQESKTYSNVQQDNKFFLMYTLRGLMSRIEQSFSSLLPRGQVALFDTDDFQRADRLQRYEAHKIGLEAGWLTVDDVRKIEDLPTGADIEIEVIA